MKTIFLPGAGGNPQFWKPVADLIPGQESQVLLGWPGLGNEPPRPGVNGLEDLVEMVLAELEGPSNLVAQSLGGVVAVKVALAAPEKIRRLVLVATSGGVPMHEFQPFNWRPDYRRAFPAAASWITEVAEDLSLEIPKILASVLLIWGDSDPISPLEVGIRLNAMFPCSRLEVIRDGDHDLAVGHASEVADLIAAHFR